MIVALGVMLVTSVLLVGVFTATSGETHLTSTDTSQKKAYYAAVAGVEDYEYHLTQDGNYLSYCTEPPSANPALEPVLQGKQRRTAQASELKTAEVPGTGESYAIQLLPAESAPSTDKKCDKNNLVETMLEEHGAATGTFRIESTGFYNGQQRSLVATFRNANFVSFVWYTKYETFDPVIYGDAPSQTTYWNRMRKVLRPVNRNAKTTTSSTANPSMARCTPKITSASAARPYSDAPQAIGSNSAPTATRPAKATPRGRQRLRHPTPTFAGTHIPPRKSRHLNRPRGRRTTTRRRTRIPLRRQDGNRARRQHDDGDQARRFPPYPGGRRSAPLPRRTQRPRSAYHSRKTA